MNCKKYGLIILSLISTLTIAAEERSEMKFDALPEAVRFTVSRFIDQKNISRIEQVSDTGYIKFEIKSTKIVNNKDFIDTDMIVSADGEIIQMAKEAPFFDIPFPIMKQLNQRYPHLKVDEVESVQRRYFQLTGNNNGQAVNLKIYDDGEIQEIPVDQDKKNQSQANQPLDQKAIQNPIVPSPGGSQAISPPIDEELQIDRSNDNSDVNQAK